MPNRIDADQGDPVDRDIRTFVDTLNAAYARYAERSAKGMAERRAVAELVRADWSAGGPVMSETRDIDLEGFRLRIHRPTAQSGQPAMLYIHGGGWMIFSIDTHDRLMREYAARAGMTVIGIDYSLAPENKFPVALEEIGTALSWIAEHAQELGVDAAHLFIGGDSAGANMAVSASLLRRDAGLPKLAGLVLNYGAFSPEVTESYRRFGGGKYCLEPAEMDEFWANYTSGPDQLSNPLVAPLLADLHDLPPACLAIAECDILADCNRAMAKRFAEAGVAVEARVYRGATHSFMEAMSIAPLASSALDEQAAWIARRLSELAESEG